MRMLGLAKAMGSEKLDAHYIEEISNLVQDYKENGRKYLLTEADLFILKKLEDMLPHKPDQNDSPEKNIPEEGNINTLEIPSVKMMQKDDERDLLSKNQGATGDKLADLEVLDDGDSSFEDSKEAGKLLDDDQPLITVDSARAYSNIDSDYGRTFIGSRGFLKSGSNDVQDQENKK